MTECVRVLVAASRGHFTNFPNEPAYNQPFFWNMEPINVDIGKLGGHIHKIFMRQNWGAEISGEQYENMRPVFHLATRFLTTASILPFWWWIFHGKRTQSRGTVYGYPNEQYMHEIHDTPESLTAEQVQQVHDRFEELSRIVTFGLKKSTPHGQMLRTAVSTSPRFQYDNILKTMSHFDGTGSHIAIDTAEFFRYQTGVENGNTGLMALSGLRLAINLCHEIAHAVEYARNEYNAYDYQDFIRDNRLMEVGWEWEKYIFGGSIEALVHRSAGSEVNECEKFPPYYVSLVVMEMRDFTKSPFPHDGYEHLTFPIRKYPEPSYVIDWLIDREILERVWKLKFWDRTVPRSGAKAFQPRKVVGLVSKAESKELNVEDRYCFFRTDCDVSDPVVVPKGWKMTDTGLIVKRINVLEAEKKEKEAGGLDQILANIWRRLELNKP
ncbi:hypothetical protein BDY21DRAFT_424569 [Lineolata rhizophorae]|uniref:Uncharacterized protein n=1 Tax=Lineolata rhizophorae TaxID=578093 RepID=A0A6A6NPF1_9PEZI|nr:hypothetical protein BDY21DRAFT_424569 [Lineolata rhizophorae]